MRRDSESVVFLVRIQTTSQLYVTPSVKILVERVGVHRTGPR